MQRSANKSVTAEFYEDFEKGQLCQKLLRRWWYALEWPKLSEIGEPPAGYESLDGFPGVFICTREDNLGKIEDMRDKDSCPSLSNISRWSCEKVRHWGGQSDEQDRVVWEGKTI